MANATYLHSEVERDAYVNLTAGEQRACPADREAVAQAPELLVERFEVR